MAKKLINVTAKMGRLIPVQNLNKKWNEGETYNSVKIENDDGKTERYLLLTKSEINRCKFVTTSELPKFTFFSDDNVEEKKPSGGKMFDQMKSGRLYVTKIESNKLRGSITSYLLALDIYENKKFEKIVIRIPMSVIKRATARAQRNPEDIATVGWFHDLLD